MHIRRITREEVHRMKRRKRIYQCVTTGIVFMVCALLVVIIVWFKKENDRVPVMQGREVTVGTAAELGESVIHVEGYDTVVRNVEDATVDDMEFVVPETGLKKVEDIQGDNWASDSCYIKSETEIVPLSYFSRSVFIGDSRTEALLLYSGLPNINGFCYKGLSVDKLESDRVVAVPGEDGDFTCYEAIDMTDYDSYYLMFGMNELGWVYIEPFIDNFGKLIDHIKQHNPDAVIYVENILPVSKEESETSDIYTQDRINEFNQALKEMCMERGDVVYLDLAAAVSGEDGYLPADASVDGIHCNADYCKRLIQYIRCNTYTKIK